MPTDPASRVTSGEQFEPGVFRRDPRGLSTVTNASAVAMPASVRHRLAIRIGDRVLLAALPGHSLVVAYPLTTLDEALAALHSRDSSSR